MSITALKVSKESPPVRFHISDEKCQWKLLLLLSGADPQIAAEFSGVVTGLMAG